MKYNLIDDAKKAEDLVRLLKDDGPTLIPFDIETTGLDPLSDSILLIQFQRPSSGEIYILNCRKLYQSDIADILKELWKNGEGSVLGHNLKFDLSFLLVNFPQIYFSRCVDTFILEFLITNGLSTKPASLAELLDKYLNIKLSKEDRKKFVNYKGAEFSNKLLEYGARDVAYLSKVHEAQRKFITSYGLEFVADVECRTVPAIAKVETDGIFVSSEKWFNNEAIAREKRYQVSKKLNAVAEEKGMQQDLFGDSINWSSPLQVLKFLRETVNPEIEDTNEKTLDKYNHPTIDLLMDYREADKLITSYGNTVLTLINPITGRLHPSFNQMGPKTGRFSCKDPNIQQVPKASVKDSSGKKHMIYREAFIPQSPDGWMVGADYNGFELRVLTDLTQEESWVQGFTEGLDMHSVVGSKVFGVPVSKAKNPELRDIGKQINFGISYGVGRNKLSKTINKIYRDHNIDKFVSDEDAGRILKNFFEEFPKIKSWQTSYVNESLSNSVMVNPYDGRLLFIQTKDRSNGKVMAAVSNEAKNYPCQSTNATVIKIAVANIQKHFFDYKLNVKLVNIIHDEVLAEAGDRESAEKAAKIIKEDMENAATFFIKTIPVKADPYIGKYWEKN